MVPAIVHNIWARKSVAVYSIVAKKLFWEVKLTFQNFTVKINFSHKIQPRAAQTQIWMDDFFCSRLYSKSKLRRRYNDNRFDFVVVSRDHEIVMIITRKTKGFTYFLCFVSVANERYGLSVKEETGLSVTSNFFKYSDL